MGFHTCGGGGVSAVSGHPISRCVWAESDPMMRAYHDEEWGVPEFDSRALWEALMLDGFQAGLSWAIILRKRDAFREAFKNFDPAKVARFGEADVTRLLENPGIVRSRAKIEATIHRCWFNNGPTAASRFDCDLPEPDLGDKQHANFREMRI